VNLFVFSLELFFGSETSISLEKGDKTTWKRLFLKEKRAINRERKAQDNLFLKAS